MSAGRTVSAEELAQHNSAENNWIAIHGKVFDVTKFAAEHPGGKKVLTNVAGKVPLFFVSCCCTHRTLNCDLNSSLIRAFDGLCFVFVITLSSAFLFALLIVKQICFSF